MGRMNLITPADVTAVTLNDDLKTLDPAAIQRFINEAEGIFSRYGLFDTAKPGYVEDMKAAAVKAVERLYIKADPDYQKNAFQGVSSFKAGSYEQKTDKAEALISGEIAAILRFYCIKRFSGGGEVWASSSPNPFTDPITE